MTAVAMIAGWLALIWMVGFMVRLGFTFQWVKRVSLATVRLTARDSPHTNLHWFAQSNARMILLFLIDASWWPMTIWKDSRV